MTTVRQIVDAVFEMAPNPSWGQENILEWGRFDAPVRGIGVAWWITVPMMKQLAEMGLNLGLTHERTTYPATENFKWGNCPTFDEIGANRWIAQVASDFNLSVHRFHSNIDLAPWGMPHAAIDQLGWDQSKVDWSRGVPVAEIQPIALGALIDHVKRSLGIPFARYDGDLSRPIRRVGMVWGGLCQGFAGLMTVLPLEVDAIIGGDVIDGVVRLAREHNVAVIDAMHHATEMRAMELLADKLRARFPHMPVHFIPNDPPWAAR